MLPSLSPSLVPIEQELQRRLFGEGLVMRTFDCTEGERLLPCGTTDNGRGGLTEACLKERTLSALERCLAGEIRLSRGLNRGLSQWLPASFLRHDLPVSAYEGTGLPCTAGTHIGCAAAGVHVGLVLPVPDITGRGPAFPHDAWTEFELGWDVRPRCAGQLSATEYARQRLEYAWGTQPCNGSSQSLFRFSGAFARNASKSCWDGQWETAMARQRAYWSHGELDAKAMGCGHPCGVHNQVGVVSGHWKRALAIFYRAREGAGKDTRSAQSSALRVALLARDVFARLGVMAAGESPLPIVEFRPASLGDLSDRSLLSPAWRQQSVLRAFRGTSPDAASAAPGEIDRAAAAVNLTVNAIQCRTAACARARRTSWGERGVWTYVTSVRGSARNEVGNTSAAPVLDRQAASTTTAAQSGGVLPLPIVPLAHSPGQEAMALPTINGSSLDVAAACRSFDPPPLALQHIFSHVLGPLRNTAISAASSPARFVVATSSDERLPWQERGKQAGYDCLTTHRVVLFAQDCQPQQVGNSEYESPRLLVELPMLQPNRACSDVLNFRGNGPEDPRLLPLWDNNAGQAQLLVLVNDYWPVAGHHMPHPSSPSAHDALMRFDKRIVTFVLTIDHGGNVTLGPARVLAPDPTLPANSAVKLSAIEKNWSPFRVGRQVFVHQWLDDPNGKSVAHRVDIHTGHLVETHVSPSGAGLRRTIGAQPHALVSGGTPAVLLDKSLCPHRKSCLLAIGHTMTSPCNDARLRAKLLNDPNQTPPARRGQYAQLHPGAPPDDRDACFWHHRGFRAYAAFAYLFGAAPPFAMVAASQEFHIDLDTGRVEPVATRCGHGDCNRAVQFPVGLSLDVGHQLLLLSWGLRDRATVLSTLPILMVLNLTKPIHRTTSHAPSPRLISSMK